MKSYEPTGGTSKTQLADAIRHVTAAVQNAIEAGHRSRAIDADDLVEVLLAIADRLDQEITTPIS